MSSKNKYETNTDPPSPLYQGIASSYIVLPILSFFSFLLSGNTYGEGLNNQGTNGNYWSSTANNNTNTYNLNFNSSNINPQNNNNKGNGNSVRCVLSS